MKDWHNTLVKTSISILEVIKIIEQEALQIALAIDETGRLAGVVTDGDIRRGILQRISLDAAVAEVMSTNPVTVKCGESRENIFTIMQQKGIQHIPVLDSDGRVVGLETWSELIKPAERNNCVVIMAGGTGNRLYPLTHNCPKPLLKVGDKPILETILESFAQNGYRRFFFAVNYKADMIEDYFGDGANWNVKIDYIREDRQLGTAGALSLLRKGFQEPVIVMNGDILTKVNFNQILDSHRKQQAQATMCVREYSFQVPYGVVELDDCQIRKISEKPVHRFFVSAGIYVLNPEVFDLIPGEAFYDMPTLFDDIIARGMKTHAFPIREYWLDIGRLSDYERANGEYNLHFANGAV